MANRTLTGGNDTSRIPNTADEAAAREARQTAARGVVSTFAMNLHPGADNGDPDALRAAREWRDDIYAVLGITKGGN